jgi:hypothetical protein
VVDLVCSEVVSLPRKAAADTLGHRMVVPGVTKPWMTRDVADACARRRLTFAHHKLDPCPVNLDRFKFTSWEDVKLSRGLARLGSNPGPAERHLSSFIRATR